MSTFQAVQDRINSDYINRDTFIEETKRAIKTAIRHYEYERRTFNETATAISATVGQGWIDFPANFLILDDHPRIAIGAVTHELHRVTPAYLRQMNASVQAGQPTHYALYQDRINLFQPPDSAYSVNVYYLKQFPELSAGGDTNPWITGGWEDVIAYHAAKLMWANVIRNDQQALKFGTLERAALDNMRGHEAQQAGGRLVPTQF